MQVGPFRGFLPSFLTATGKYYMHRETASTAAQTATWGFLPISTKLALDSQRHPATQLPDYGKSAFQNHCLPPELSRDSTTQQINLTTPSSYVCSFALVFFRTKPLLGLPSLAWFRMVHQRPKGNL